MLVKAANGMVPDRPGWYYHRDMFGKIERVEVVSYGRIGGLWIVGPINVPVDDDGRWVEVTDG